MAIDPSQFHQLFFEESTEGIKQMESSLLALEPDRPDPELINAIFRAAHSIKGGGATFGFTPLAEFTHLLETLLDEVRDGRRQPTQPLIDLLFSSTDVLTSMIETLRSGGTIDPTLAGPVASELQQALHGAATPPSAGEATAAVAPSAGWSIRFTPHAHLLQTGNDPLRILRSLAELGDLRVSADYSRLPDLDSLDPEQCFLAWELELHGDIPRSEIDSIFEWVEGDCDLAIEPLPGAAIPAPAAAATVAPAETQAAPAPIAAPPPLASSAKTAATSARTVAATPHDASSIRVNSDKIDTLIDLLGEIVITQSMLNQLGESLEIADQLGREKLRDGLANLESNTRDLQEAVMRIRMLPVSFAFQRFPRLVRDSSRQLGKQIELTLSGEQTEIDKTVLERISDPLVHLVRNALDHGIEKPEVRAANGKPETGHIHLSASHQGSNIVIRIADDGAGLNRERILRKAIERQLVAPGANLSDHEINDLIFQPGFSTAEQVSDLSGRGVGMDVVRRNIEAVGGSIEIVSEAGKGSSFTIRLPLTLAIMDGQLIRAEGETFVIPLLAISELLQIRPELIRTMRGQAELYHLRDRYIPLLRLSDTFRLHGKEGDGEMLIVVENGSELIGLVVDEFLGQQQVVIKNLEQNFRQLDGISGATILGDGTVALILDIAGLTRMWRREPRRAGGTRTAGRSAPRNPSMEVAHVAGRIG